MVLSHAEICPCVQLAMWFWSRSVCSWRNEACSGGFETLLSKQRSSHDLDRPDLHAAARASWYRFRGLADVMRDRQPRFLSHRLCRVHAAAQQRDSCATVAPTFVLANTLSLQLELSTRWETQAPPIAAARSHLSAAAAAPSIEICHPVGNRIWHDLTSAAV